MSCQMLVTESLNADKTKFALFHKVRQRDNIPLVWPTLTIINTLIKRVLYQSLIRWKSNMEQSNKSYWEQNIKKPRYLTSSQILLNQKSRRNVYFSFIHSYIYCGNIVSERTYKTKLNKVLLIRKKHFE